MRHIVRTWLAGLALVTIAGAAGAATTTRVIVELEGQPAAVWRAHRLQQGQAVSDTALATYRNQLLAAQDTVLGRIAAAGIAPRVGTVAVPGATGTPVAVQKRYTLVYNGFGLDVAPADVVRLRGVAGVAGVHRVRLLTTDLDHSVPFIRAPELYGGVAELGPFDDLREGYEGQGIVVAVIDTGIEWHHEMFGGDPTPPRLGLAPASALVPTNPKVVYYLPFVDLAVEDGLGHGTHVASTAAGYLGIAPGADGLPGGGDDIPLHGVAPQARLMSYKVCSDLASAPGLLGVGIGGCLSDLTILALEDAVSPRTLSGFAKPVANVINLSLGGEFGSPDDPTAVASSNAALMGAVVVAAAGNSGSVPGIVGSPSTGRHVISVANATDPGSGANWYVDAGERSEIAVYPMAGTPAPPGGGLSERFVYVQNSSTAADYPPEVSGRIALIENGHVVGAFAEVANNAALAGAVAALFIGDTENPTAVRATIPAAIIRPDDAAYLLGLLGPSPQQGDVSADPITLERAGGSFRAEIAGSSSRGPVLGLGQVKPDLAAPGTNILAAMPPASVLGAVTTADGLTYGAISGTSMASPHVAGAAALVKQANPSWTPDMVRTALINTATPMRDAANRPDGYGPQNPDLHSQGGGYVDVFRAAHAKALMGVVGDGVDQPGILGSHSFGGSPVIGDLCVNQQQVQVILRDVRGTGCSYTLSVADDRELARAGIGAGVSPATVTVPPGGSATFTATVSFDGGAIADAPQLDVQWFVVADRTDGSERLAMPLFYRALPAAPASDGGSRVETEVHEGTLGAGSVDAGVGEQSADVPVEVPGGTFRLAGLLEADEVTNVAYPDLDLELYDPNGNLIGSSGNPGGVESVDVAVSTPGTYVFRVVNYLDAGSSYTLTVDKHIGANVGPAGLAPIPTEHVEQDDTRVDFDGSFSLSWVGVGGETGYRVERSVDGGGWELLAAVDAGTTAMDVSDLPDGDYAFRVRSEFPGVLCTYVEQPSAVQAVRVERRVQVAADEVAASITRASLADGVFQVDVVLTNQGAEALLNPVTLAVVGIDSSSGDVVLRNADNGGSGTSVDDPGLFAYEDLVDGESLEPGETSAVRTLVFADPSNQMFSFHVQVTGYRTP